MKWYSSPNTPMEPPKIKHCPSCQFGLKEDLEECPRCGIIFKKWQARQKLHPPSLRRPSSSPSSQKSLKGPVILFLMVVAAIFLVAEIWPRPQGFFSFEGLKILRYFQSLQKFGQGKIEKIRHHAKPGIRFRSIHCLKRRPQGINVEWGRICQHQSRHTLGIYSHGPQGFPKTMARKRR